MRFSRLASSLAASRRSDLQRSLREDLLPPKCLLREDLLRGDSQRSLRGGVSRCVPAFAARRLASHSLPPVSTFTAGASSRTLSSVRGKVYSFPSKRPRLLSQWSFAEQERAAALRTISDFLARFVSASATLPAGELRGFGGSGWFKLGVRNERANRNAPSRAVRLG